MSVCFILGYGHALWTYQNPSHGADIEPQRRTGTGNRSRMCLPREGSHPYHHSSHFLLQYKPRCLTSYRQIHLLLLMGRCVQDAPRVYNFLPCPTSYLTKPRLEFVGPRHQRELTPSPKRLNVDQDATWVTARDAMGPQGTIKAFSTLVLSFLLFLKNPVWGKRPLGKIIVCSLILFQPLDFVHVYYMSKSHKNCCQAQ